MVFLGKILVILLLAILVSGRQWEKMGRAQRDQWIPLRVALNQQNLDILEATLVDVSDPYSPNYGNWWTASEVLDLVAPPKDISELVVKFLRENGARAVENHRDMIKFEIKISSAEELFQTSLYNYLDAEGERLIVRTRSGYSIPSEIAAHVFLISGLQEFPTLKRTMEEMDQSAPADSGIVTVGHIQALYGIPETFPVHPNSSFALVEFADYPAYGPDDLALFTKVMGVPPIEDVKILGKDNYTNPGLESELDIQYGGALALNTSIWFWTLSGWMYEYATDLQAMENPPLVCSISWISSELENCEGANFTIDPCYSGPEVYTKRVNTEFMKIGMRGITIVSGSGDQGAPGSTNPNCLDPQHPNMTMPMSSNFPGSSPWVLGVGATMLVNVPGNPVSSGDPHNASACNLYPCATSMTEAVCSYPESLITTGGGFSNFLAMPSYQSAVVDAYLSSGVPLPPANTFNSSNRASPDVSALGNNYYILAKGKWWKVAGTSASTPVVASMISLLNSYRLNHGKKPLGAVAPLMYAAYNSDPSIFNDMTSGDNKCTETCCGKIGYEATKGWDPVTGLGTPQFQKLLSFISTLPN